MNFSEQIKTEILSKPIKEDHCKRAFISGLVRGSGKLYADETEGLGVTFNAFSEQTAMLVVNYFEKLYDYEIREVSVSEDRLNKKDKFVLSVGGARAEEILSDLGILKKVDGETVVNLKMFSPFVSRECCVKSFVKGLFLSAGSCTLPSSSTGGNTGYHLEIVFSHYTPALETSETLNKYGVKTKILKRKDNYVLYIKSAEEIKNFTAFLQTPKAVLKITDLMINRELINDSNRRKNCDLGNLSRQIEAVSKQIEAIDKIKRANGLDELSAELKETALARVDYPEETLSELAERLSVSKSCLNHRLRKIVQIAKEI